MLGTIESSVVIERRILEIVQQSRTDAEINAAFDNLQEEFSAEIDEVKQNARSKLLAEMDEKVVQRLLDRRQGLNATPGDFKQALLNLARAELPDARFRPDHAERLDFDGRIWSTEWPEADERGWQFFRLGDGEAQGGGLADSLVARAKGRDLTPAALRFD